MTEQKYFRQRQETILQIALGAIIGLVSAIGLTIILNSIPSQEEITAPQERVISVDTIRVKSELSDWQVLLLAVAMTESEFHPEAMGSNNDWGILQITPIYVEEVNRIMGDSVYCHEDAWSVERSLEMFNIVQEHRNPEHDVDKALRLHNKNPWYVKRVKQNMEFVRRYEKFRTVLEDNQ